MGIDVRAPLLSGFYEVCTPPEIAVRGTHVPSARARIRLLRVMRGFSKALFAIVQGSSTAEQLVSTRLFVRSRNLCFYGFRWVVLARSGIAKIADHR